MRIQNKIKMAKREYLNTIQYSDESCLANVVEKVWVESLSEPKYRATGKQVRKRYTILNISILFAYHDPK